MIAYKTKGPLDAHCHNILREHLIEGGRAGPLSACTLLSYRLHLTLPSVLFVVTVFLIAQLAGLFYDPYPGPSFALHVCASPQFMPVEQKSVREPSET